MAAANTTKPENVASVHIYCIHVRLPYRRVTIYKCRSDQVRKSRWFFHGLRAASDETVRCFVRSENAGAYCNAKFARNCYVSRKIGFSVRVVAEQHVRFVLFRYTDGVHIFALIFRPNSLSEISVFALYFARRRSPRPAKSTCSTCAPRIRAAGIILYSPPRSRHCSASP